MKTNLSIFDSILRLFIGMIFAAVCGAMGWIIGVLALYPIVTALTSFDPIYKNMGFSTAKEHCTDSDKIDYSEPAGLVASGAATQPAEYRKSA